MPSKARDSEGERPSGKRRHTSIRSSRKSSSKDRLRSSTTLTTPNTPSKRRTSMPVPELERRASSTSPSASKTSLPYPSFSKAHSKEAVGSRDNVVNPRLSYYTPDPTDLDQRKKQSEEDGPNNVTPAAPPSPPLTQMDQPERVVKVDRLEKVERKRTDLQKAADELKRKLSRATSVTEEKPDRHRSTRSTRSHRELKDGESPRRSKTSTPLKSKAKPATVEETSSAMRSRHTLSPVRTSSARGTTPPSIIDSDATSVAPNQAKPQPPRTEPDRRASPPTEPDSSPRTPTPTEPGFPPSRKETPAFSVLSEGYSAYEASPMPPPPPPPPNVPFQQPKVDYLLQNGGLLQTVPKNLLSVGQSQPQDPNHPPIPHSAQVASFFAPFNSVLEDYTKVVNKNGSMAVATGYRSIARRLLDRLEAVFARDISSETCTCIVCQSNPQPFDSGGEGVSWGEILEYVSGRRELPSWPPFVLDSAQTGLGISTTEAPCQKLDIDVPEEYKEHYINQSKKTKQSVDRWLASQPSNPTPAPQDVDDETLTFAMLTRLEPHQRPTFSTLVGVVPTRPNSTASTVSQTPTNAPSSDLLPQTALAIQRLYRLSSLPRDPEAAIYLLSNPTLHNVLATLAAISDHEWDILTSGRFDGFLRSGADDLPPPSRGATPSVPANVSRNPTPAPASAGAPVALDEETEIAVLAEVEREIYLGMEALEDAFEALHVKAESVRLALRERGAGLSMACQARRGGAGASLDARLGTPASGLGGGGEARFEWESETEDGWGVGSEIAPDDSASNVSRSRRRRPKRREERRTPAPVEEEDEDE